MPELFVYGTLMDPAQVARLLGHPLSSEGATADGFVKATLPGLPYPFAVEDPSAVIEGLLLLGLNDSDVRCLDVYERVEHHLFLRRTVDVQVGNTSRQAWMYVGGPSLLRRWSQR